MHVHVDPNSPWAKVIIVLGSPLFVAFLWFQALNFFRAYESRTWPTAKGTIVTSEVERDFGPNGPRVMATVRYAYKVGQEEFENDKIAFGLFRGMMTWGYADRKVSKFPQGQMVDVFYDPHEPGVSCLEQGGIGWEDIFMLFVSGSGTVMAVTYVSRYARRRLGLSANPADPRLPPTDRADQHAYSDRASTGYRCGERESAPSWAGCRRARDS